MLEDKRKAVSGCLFEAESELKRSQGHLRVQQMAQRTAKRQRLQGQSAQCTSQYHVTHGLPALARCPSQVCIEVRLAIWCVTNVMQCPCDKGCTAHTRSLRDLLSRASTLVDKQSGPEEIQSDAEMDPLYDDNDTSEPHSLPLTSEEYIALLGQITTRHPEGRLTRIAHGQSFCLRIV